MMASGYGKSWNSADHYKDARVARDYDRERFSSLAGRVYNLLEKRLVRLTFEGLPKNTTIVDVPCGTGRLAEVLLDSGYSVTGIDISAPMLEIARQRVQHHGDRFQTHVIDARILAGTGLQFDCALCARVLMHLPLPEQIEFLRNVAAVTRRRVVFTQSLDTPYHRFRRHLKRLLGHQAPAVTPSRLRSCEHLVVAAGLIEVRRCMLLPLISEAIVIVAEPTRH